MAGIRTDKKKLLAIGIHILGWLLFFSFPWLMRMNLPFSMDIPWQITLKNNAHLLLLAILFYVNYLFLIPKYLFRKKFLYYSLAVLTILVLAVLTNAAFNSILDAERAAIAMRMNWEDVSRGGAIIQEDASNPPHPHRFFIENRQPDSLAYSRFPTIRIRFLRWGVFDLFSVLSSLFILLLGTGIKFGQQWFKNERQKEEIEKEKLQTELSFLKSQINPHFFFNMLNNIYSLIQSKPETAQETVHKLSRLMRYVLYDSSKERVTLREEIEFIENYIELAKIRISKATTVHFTPSVTDPGTPVPPLLYISFLENIFKHGVRQNEVSSILISLTQSNEAITFTSQNRIFHNQTQIVHGEGIGLNNVKRRLDLLYGDNYSLSISTQNGFFKVNLTIPVYENQMYSH